MIVNSDAHRLKATLHIGRMKIGLVNSLQDGGGWSPKVAAGYFLINFAEDAKMVRLSSARSKYNKFKLLVGGDKFVFQGKVLAMNQKKHQAKLTVKPGTLVTYPSYD